MKIATQKVIKEEENNLLDQFFILYTLFNVNNRGYILIYIFYIKWHKSIYKNVVVLYPYNKVD